MTSINGSSKGYELERVRRIGRLAFTIPDLKAAVEGLGELMVRQSKADTLVSALAAVEEVATQLSQALTPKIEVKTGTDP